MKNTTILILGGYGNTGKPLARLLLQESRASLILAGRSLEKAQAAVNELNGLFPGNRAAALALNAADSESLVQAFHHANLVVVASSTVQFTRQVAEAALQAGIDYLDVQFSTQKISVLQSLQSQIENAGCCFITEGGFHPGLPAALVRYAAGRFDQLKKANVGSVIKIDWNTLSLTQSTIDELIQELNSFKMLVYKDGRWKKASLTSTRDMVRMDFGREFGKQYAAPMLLEEMRTLPETIPTLVETGFYVGGFNWFVDWLVMPLAMLALRISPQGMLKPMGELMLWGLNTFSRPPYGVLLKLEAEGLKYGNCSKLDLTLYHPDGYMFTAIPVAACLLQYLDGSIKHAGLWTQANLVEPVRLLRDMQRMGVEIVESQS